MRKLIAFLVFGCAVILMFAFTSEAPASAAEYIEINNFYGSIQAYDYYGNEYIHEKFSSNPISFVDYSFFTNVIKLIFYPAKGKFYEYSTDNVNYSPITYGLTVTNIRRIYVMPAVSYNAVFMTDEAESAVVKVRKGERIALTPTPDERIGERHIGWKEEGTEDLFDFNTPIERDYTFIPVYETVNYDIVFVYKESARMTYTVGAGIFAESPPDCFEGKSITGWAEADGVVFDFDSTVICKNYTFYPVFESVTQTFTLIFKDTEGNVIAARTVAEGGFAEDIPAPPNLPLHESLDWSKEGENNVFYFKSTPITEDHIFVPLYRKTHAAIAYKIDGITVRTDAVLLGGVADMPDIPARDGHTAIWKKQGEAAAFDFCTVISEDITLTAEYLRVSYAVFFEIGGGSLVAGDASELSQQVLYGDNAAAPQIAPPYGYEFLGWDKEFCNVSADITVTACYRQIKCRLTFCIYGNTPYEAEVNYGTTVASPLVESFDIALLPGYYLEGWTCAENGGGLYDFSKPITASHTFVAAVAKYRFSIKYYDGNDEIIDTTYSKEVFYGDTVEPPEAPAKQHAEFDFWSVEPKGDRPYNFTAPITGDLKLYARYTSLKFTVQTQISDGINYNVSAVFADIGNTITYSYTLPEGYILVEEAVWAGSSKLATAGQSFIMPSSDVVLQLTLSASKYPINVYANGSLAAAVTYGEEYLPTPSETPPHYIFAGWFADAELTCPYGGIIKAPYGEAIYLYPSFKKEIYEITFYVGYGSPVAVAVQAVYGDLPEPPTPPSDEYLVFAGWDKEILIAEYDAEYTSRYKMFFDKKYYDGEALLLSVKGELGTEPDTLSEPQKEGYEFKGFVLSEIDADAHLAEYYAVFSALPTPPNEEELIAEPEEAPDAEPTNTEQQAPETISSDSRNVIITADKTELLVLLFYAIVMARLVAVFFATKRKRDKIIAA